jgi:hypothetical protein
LIQNFTDYELLVKEVYTRLLQQDGFKNINVQHNIKLTGKSGATHQIDIFWNLQIAGIEQLFCVECKYWKSTVKKSDIASFSTILDDINARGFFVTTKGFQKGAQQLAIDKNINIVTINKNIDKQSALLQIDWPSYENIEPKFDNEIDTKTKNVLDKWINNIIKNKIGIEEIKIYDKSSRYICGLQDLVQSNQNYEDRKYIIPLDNKYINIDGLLIKVTEISYDFYRNHMKDLDLEGYVEIAIIIVEDIIKNSKQIIDLER